MKFTVHTLDTAPADAKKMLVEINQRYGFVPNLIGIMAESPALLEAYTTVYKLFEQTSLTEIEKQVILLTVSYANSCEYCVAAHSTIAHTQNISSNIIDSIRDGKTLSDSKLEALRCFTLTVVTTRGRPSSKDTESFLNAGYTTAQILEVILGVGLKTLSNYTNHIANTPLDDGFSDFVWQKNP